LRSGVKPTVIVRFALVVLLIEFAGTPPPAIECPES
jgi:hypothetical protein